jgi:hypothetical protein
MVTAMQVNHPVVSLIKSWGLTISQRLCNGKFCKLIKRFNVPSESELYGNFIEYLRAHGAEGIGIYIGTKAEVQRRTQCPFCRFTQRVLAGSRYSDAPDSSKCFLQLKFEAIWLTLRASNGAEIGLLIGLGKQIVLVGHSEQAGPKTGCIVDPGPPNYGRIMRWLELCDSLHKTVCPVPSRLQIRRQNIPHLLRVVDLVDNCLVDIDWQERYVALSYVWGSANPPMLKKSNQFVLSKLGSLKQLRRQMPATIRDVMEFAAKIGLRYLWFDSLCLVQDDPRDLRLAIMNMDVVYEGAYVTVIAANGAGADSGLPGMGAAARVVTQDLEELKSGLQILQVKSLDSHLNPSVWGSRGWT